MGDRLEHAFFFTGKILLPDGDWRPHQMSPEVSRAAIKQLFLPRLPSWSLALMLHQHVLLAVPFDRTDSEA
jgi:hypothetical protein